MSFGNIVISPLIMLADFSSEIQFVTDKKKMGSANKMESLLAYCYIARKSSWADFTKSEGYIEDGLI